jgi:hypothetical protein
VSNSSVRTVVIFSIIALILGGAAIGGVRLIKARNNSFASSQAKPVAQADTKKQDQQAQPQKQQQKQSEDKSKTQTQQPAAQQQQQTPKPAAPSTPTPTQPAPDTSKKVAATPPTPQSVPDTSAFSPSDILPTFTLMIIAAFFGSKILRARADYRRYISL